MSPEFIQELDRLGRRLNRWEAQVRGAWWLAAALGWLVGLSLIDVFVPVSRAGRALRATGLLALVGFAAWRTIRTLRKS